MSKPIKTTTAGLYDLPIDVKGVLFEYLEYADLLSTIGVSHRWKQLTLVELQKRKKYPRTKWAYFGGTWGRYTRVDDTSVTTQVDIVGQTNASGIPPLPEPLIEARGCVLDNGKIVIAGSKDSITDTALIYVFFPGKGWKKVPPLPEGRQRIDFTVVSAGTAFDVIGGFRRDASDSFFIYHQMDKFDGKWTPMQDIDVSNCINGVEKPLVMARAKDTTLLDFDDQEFTDSKRRKRLQVGTSEMDTLGFGYLLMSEAVLSNSLRKLPAEFEGKRMKHTFISGAWITEEIAAALKYSKVPHGSFTYTEQFDIYVCLENMNWHHFGCIDPSSGCNFHERLTICTAYKDGINYAIFGHCIGEILFEDYSDEEVEDEDEWFGIPIVEIQDFLREPDDQIIRHIHQISICTPLREKAVCLALPAGLV